MTRRVVILLMEPMIVPAAFGAVITDAEESYGSLRSDTAEGG